MHAIMYINQDDGFYVLTVKSPPVITCRDRLLLRGFTSSEYPTVSVTQDIFEVGRIHP